MKQAIGAMWQCFLDTNIAIRLGIGFGVLVFLIFAFGLLVLYQMTELKEHGEVLYRHPFTVSRAVDAVEIRILKIHREMKDLAHAVDSDHMHAHQSRVHVLHDEALQHLDTARSRFLGDPQAVETVHQSLLGWQPIGDEVIRLRLAGNLAAADAITREAGAQHVALIEQQLNTLKSFASRKAMDSMSSARMILRKSTIMIGLVLVAAILLGIAIAVLITRSIRTPLTRLDLAAEQVSRGDLKQQVAVHSTDELGRLASTFNSMVINIQEQTAEIKRKNEENERLLLNILPGPVAERLKQGEEDIADYFPEVTVLFADIVGFTAMSGSIAPDELVKLLNELFTAFDESAHRTGIEKIKTIGDSYMAVAGLSIQLDSPTLAMIEMAFEMQRAVEDINNKQGTAFQIRIGINCGPVVAGVIGKSKFIYDLWGDTVNLASRMESHGVPGCIHVSESVHERIRGRIAAEPRGEISIRGKGHMSTYLICNQGRSTRA